MRALLIALTLALVTACAPATAPTPGGDAAETPTSAPIGVPAETAACRARGGELAPVCRMQTIQCVIRYADAGQACRDGDDCQGDCRAADVSLPAGSPATGQCQATSDLCGCFANVEDGRTTAGLCAD